MTTLVAEEALAKKRYDEMHGSSLGWYGLKAYQQLYLAHSWHALIPTP